MIGLYRIFSYALSMNAFGFPVCFSIGSFALQSLKYTQLFENQIRDKTLCLASFFEIKTI